MASVTQKFVLIGPHAGRSMVVNGHEFVDGEFTYAGSEGQAATLARVLEFYGAVPAEKAELEQLRSERTGPIRADLDKALSELPGDQTDPEYVVKAMSAHFGELFTAEDEAKVRELVKAQASQDASGNQAGAQGSAASTETTGADQNKPNGADQNKPNGAPDSKPSLAEAIGQLDPETDAHWTSNNLPNLEHLSELIGKKVARDEVNAVAEGYTRAKARAAKQ